jgi:CHAD domain-containing protein
MADGIVVDIVFERSTASAEDEAPPHRELRLTTPYVENAVGASLTALFAMANELVAALPAFPVLRTALDRAYDVGSTPEPTPARAAPIDLTGISTPHAALIAIGRNLADHWFGNDAGVRDAVSTEFVHQMRVAQRRLRTAMRIFPHWTDDLSTTRIAPDLKWLGAVLGDARDWDVFVDSTLPTLAAADADRTRWNTTRETANARRLEARERVQAAAGSTRYARLALAWLEWLSALPSREPPAKAADVSLRAYAKKRVHKYYERLMSAPKLTTLDDEARHKERIQAKYLRYTLEFFESIASPKTRSETAKTVSRMQGVLGDGNDAAVALCYLEQLEVEPYQSGFARGWCEATKRYTAQEGEHLLRSLRKPKITGGEPG